MYWKLIFGGFLVAAVLLFDTPTSQARVISRGNQHQFFNIHGVNYRSMKWERERGNRRALFSGRRGLFRRR